MTTLDDLFNALRRMMQGKTTKAIASASGVDVLAVRKIRRNMNIGTLKMETIYKIFAGLNAMNGEADND